MPYMNAKLHTGISEHQKGEIAKAITEQRTVNIRLSYENLQGEDILALPKTRANQLAKAYKEKTGVILKLSKSQLQYSKKTEG